MTIRTRPGVDGQRASAALRNAVTTFHNLQGRSLYDIALYNDYLVETGNQVRLLSSILSRDSMDQILTTPRYWMLHNMDPAGKAPIIGSLMNLELEEKLTLLNAALSELQWEVAQFEEAELIVVPDTNILLHNDAPIDEIAWERYLLGDTGRIILAIPVRVIDELDKAKRRNEKVENGTESIRTRARKTLRIMEAWFKDGGSGDLGDARSIRTIVVLDDPTLPREPEADREIIETARNIADLSMTPTVLSTTDIGMQLRAQKQGVRAEGLPA